MPEDDNPYAEYIRSQIEMVQRREEARRARAMRRASRRHGRGRASVAERGEVAPLAERSVLSAELLRLGPNVIGGSGGSGTRVVARVAHAGSMFTGNDLNEAHDELTYFVFDERWIDEYVLAQAQGRPIGELRGMARDFETFISRLCAPIQDQPRPWGWKMPRSLLLLPFLHAQFPAMRFVHVIRDGRYLAYSQQQYTLWRHRFLLLDPTEQRWSQPAQAMALWRRTNLAAADYGEQRMGERYLRVRFEDLCADPIPIVHRLLFFLGLSGDAAAIAHHEVQAPPASRPWEHADPDEVAHLLAIGTDALHRFGYLDLHEPQEATTGRR